jgi:hypothetical protein
LDDVISSVTNDKEAQKAYNSSTAKAFNAMNQKVKKEVKAREDDVNYFKEVISIN